MFAAYADRIIFTNVLLTFCLQQLSFKSLICNIINSDESNLMVILITMYKVEIDHMKIQFSIQISKLPHHIQEKDLR